MGNSRFIKNNTELTPFADLKELRFVNNFKGKTEKYSKQWYSEIVKRSPIVHKLRKDINFKGRILEIGSGSSWFSAELSKIPEVHHIFCLDFSKRLLSEVAPFIFNTLKAKTNKITRIIDDYHKLPFDNNSFDFVVVDAALHHTNYLNILLEEVYRVLKNDGFVVAIREPIKSIIWPIKKKFGLVDKPVKEYGMVENTYSKKIWKKYFQRAGFNITIKQIFYRGGLKEKLIGLTPLRLFNGILYSRYYLIASKK